MQRRLDESLGLAIGLWPIRPGELVLHAQGFGLADRFGRADGPGGSIGQGGKFVRTIEQTRATTVMTMMAARYNLKRLASFLENKVDAFFKPTRSKRQVRLQTGRA
ncbi:hypothetical protein HNP33_003464 [Comamonas odontotermitis]|uniref:Uncharacterized protein n=1 Tax=Comamonas odontotermitis TaxID=379895 RepID=A0ABR6RJM4_9BURK|nr:hypothetical protein [Comamonas odontotermitis]